MQSLIDRLYHSTLGATLTNFAVFAFVVAPALKIAITTAGGNWS